MEISLSPLEFTPRNNSTSVAPATAAPSLEVRGDVPAVVVTITPPVETPAVYSEPVTVVSYLRDKSHTGTAAQATNQALLGSLAQIKNGKAPVAVSHLFSQVAALGRETGEYRNEVREFRVPSRVAVDKFTPDFTAAKGKRMESVFLSLRTRDGDNIHIQFGRNTIRDGTSVMTFSFEVEGELSEGEHQALAALMEKLGAMGDEFFRSDTTELRGLKELDRDFIAGFSFKLQRYNPATDSYVEHSYEYRVDEVAQTQTLRAGDVNGYQVDITTQLSRLADQASLEAGLLQAYLDLIAHAADKSSAPNASTRFMLDAFSSLFDGYLTLATEKAGLTLTQANLAAFDSGMPDFSASFRSPVYHNPGFYSQIAAMSLTMEQQTRREQTGENQLVKQQTGYQLSYSKFANIPNQALDMLGGFYTYIQERESAETNRILSMTGDRVNNLWVEQEADRETTRLRFENYKLVDKEAYSYGDRQLEEYAELLKKLNANNQHSAVHELLMASKGNIFLNLM